MNDPLSRVHVYQMSDADARASVAELLRRVDDLSVECAGPLYCLTVTCRDANQARCVHRLVTLTDPKAVLLNTAYRTSAAASISTQDPL